MGAQKIKEGIYWVGVIDWNLRSFHGYSTESGTTYNAYLIVDEKITLIDNVKEEFTNEMLKKISSIVDISKIDIIISNHSEADHSGSLKKIMEIAKNATVYASVSGVKILQAMYGSLDVIPVKTNDEISIGKRTLKFFQAPMVHWPDNMVTYVKEDKILFSNDIFGQHYATSKILDVDNELDVILYEAKKYYANIVLPYTLQASKIAEVILTLDFDMIATSHGVVWTKNIKDVVELYKRIIANEKKEKAVIVYDTMWHSTEKIAKAISEGFIKNNIEVKLFNINVTEASNILTEIIDAKYLGVGSPTQNNQMLPPIAAFLCYLESMHPKGLTYIAFGSYGWSGQSIGLVAEKLVNLGYKELLPQIKVTYVPNEELLQKITNQIVENTNKD
ncbi:MAG: FprA family A-type flavoprotein [Bacilli bacterium]|nr:FprA family A-type flavoprotein [Bacilli bacterium]